jgi:hypothetical protein
LWKRGLFVSQTWLCQLIPPPPPGVPVTPPEGLTARQRAELHRSSPACAACHQLFDPYGIALEQFDNIGRFRTTDQGLPIDVSTTVFGRDIDGAADLGRELSANPAVTDCLVKHYLDYAIAEPLSSLALDSCSVREVSQAFRDGPDPAFSGLIREVARSTVLLTRSRSR